MELKEIILSILEHHRGRENAIKGHVLLYQINREIYPDHVGDRKMRETIEEEIPKVAFCTTAPGGYFLPLNIGEVNKTIESINSYIKGFAKRKKALLTAYPDANQGVLPGCES